MAEHAVQPHRFRAWLLSWGPPLAVGLFWFVASFPGMLHGDSWYQWRTAWRIVSEPGVVEITDWFSPLLTMVRVWALQSGIDHQGFHALYCLLTYGTWALLVATLLRRPWQRTSAHALLLLPFIGGNLAFQAADVLLATGLALVIVALARWSGEKPGQGGWVTVAVYSTGCLLALSARTNAWLIGPLLIALPVCLAGTGRRMQRIVAAASPIVAGAVILTANAQLPVRHDMKAEVYATFEIIGTWKLASAEQPEAQPPAVFGLLSEPAEYYFERWDHSDVDTLIWYTDSLRDRSLYRPPNRDLIRADYLDTIRRFPGSFLEMKLLVMRNGLGYTEPRDDAVGWLEPDDWSYEEWAPSIVRNAGVRIAHFAADAREVLRPLWEPLIRPWLWWLIYAGSLGWRLARRRVSAFDAAATWLVAGYHATVLITAPAFYPRYAFPVWMLLGVLSLRMWLYPRTPTGGRLPRTGYFV